MNLLLLPKHLQDLISEYNVEHRPLMRSVMDELDHYWNCRNKTDKYCDFCDDKAQEQYSKYILWKKFNFCGERCMYEGEHCILKNYRR